MKLYLLYEKLNIIRNIVKNKNSPDLQNFTTIELDRIFLATQPKNIYCGSDSIFIIDKNKNVWGCGKTGNNIFTYNLTQIPYLENIIQIISRQGYSLFLDVNDIMYLCGSSFKAIVDPKHIYKQYEDYQIPVIVPNLPKMTKIAGFSSSILMLDFIGNVFICESPSPYDREHHHGGGNYEHKYAQLKYNIPTKISNVSNIIDIAVGESIYLLLNNKGVAFYFVNERRNNYYKLDKDIITSIPTEITSFAEIQQIDNTLIAKNPTHIISVQCGIAHFILLDKYGDVYSFGNNCTGQLGINFIQDKKLGTTPTKIPSLHNIISISTLSNNSLALDMNGKVFGFGMKHKNFFTLNATNLILPIKLDFYNITQISIYYEHHLLMNNNGVIYAMGDNSAGQLSIGCKTRSVKTPTKIFTL